MRHGFLEAFILLFSSTVYTTFLSCGANVLQDGANVTDAQADARIDASRWECGLPPFRYQGVFGIVGEDPRWGEYSGEAEICGSLDEGYRVVHIRHWKNAEFEGDQIAAVWEGVFNYGQEGPNKILFTLDQVGFITSYDQHERNTATTTAPIVLEGTFHETTSYQAELRFVPLSEPAYVSKDELTFSETWTGYGGNCEEETIWENKREIIPGHDPPPPEVKNTMFEDYASFHDLPEVKPYVGRPEFEEAVHYWVFDPTDFEFYRQHRNVLRVIQKVVDPISLVEARMRNRAYRQTLGEKALIFGLQMSYDHGSPFVNQAGMLTYEGETGDTHSLLRTGVFVAGQALRYMTNEDQHAIDNMIHSLNGIFACNEITSEPGEFARTLRDHVPEDENGEWLHGTSPYEYLDWLPGGDHEMVKGILLGFVFSYFALDYAGIEIGQRERMYQIISDLLANNEMVMSESTQPVNRLVGVLLLFMLSDDTQEKTALATDYEKLFETVQNELITESNGSTYEWGISNWSGNHLNLTTLLVLHTLASTVEGDALINDSHRDDYEEVMRKGLDRMQRTRLGLYQLVFAALGYDVSHNRFQDALWVLREFPAPKTHYDFDHRIHPDFCISPFPDNPWKNDWTDADKDRTNPLIVPPLFEQNPDDYQWKSKPTYKGMETTPASHSADYLFAYWFAAFHGGIDSNM